MNTGLLVTFKGSSIEIIEDFLIQSTLFGYLIEDNTYQFDCKESEYDSTENELIYELDKYGIKNYYIEGIWN